MKTINPITVMWMTLNYKHILSTMDGGALEKDDILTLAYEADYMPIDSDTCLVISDCGECAHILRKSGMEIISVTEVPEDFIK